MLGCFNTEWKTLTWLRYTVWMPLYPLGVLAEGRLFFFLYKIWYKKHANMFIDSFIYTLISQSHVALAVIQSIPIFDESKLFSIPLTKVIGTSVSFSYFLYIYLVLMFLGKSPHELSLTWHIYSNLTTAALILILVPPPPHQRTFYQLSPPLQAEEEALPDQKEESKLRLNTNSIPWTPLLPAYSSTFVFNNHHPYVKFIINSIFDSLSI